MSTNHTANYELCQWEPTDQVQRLDFNADNAKLDAALQALQQSIAAEAAARGTAIQGEQQARAALQAELLALMPSVKLGEWSLTSAAQQLLVDLSGKDLSSFTGLRVVYDGRGCSGFVCLQVNGITNGYFSTNLSSSITTERQDSLTAGNHENCRSAMEIYPGKNGLCAVWDFVSYKYNSSLSVSRFYGFIPSLQIADVEELKFYSYDTSSGAMGAGTSVTVYGLRD